MPTKPWYKSTGFYPLNCLQGVGTRLVKAAAVTIAKGDAIFDNGSGYGTNGTTAFAATFLGIAAEACVNAAGAAGDLSLMVIPPEAGYAFWVANASTTQAAQTDVGEVIDLEANNNVDVSDVTVTANGWGFLVDEIDVSTEALAADGVVVTGGGFVKGHFVRT